MLVATLACALGICSNAGAATEVSSTMVPALVMQEGERLRGFVAVQSLVIPKGVVIYVEETTQVDVADRIISFLERKVARAPSRKPLRDD